MEVGPQNELFNKKAVMVAPEDADRARSIIADFLERKLPEEDEATSHFSLSQKLRMIFEAVFFMWFMPGKKKCKRADKTEGCLK